ncbi:ABC transporter ATP-binding protein [Phaeocystidibacter luteus]|uniref:ABC transporter ATP-binding protein n=1 Tax=Phaeocystidibacter luteus TaxID=911197 RepID=A0A6N6RMW9_9FLAO|nr:ABC transporter ATP-binding protein [Phaeocystidibacter luteus]KAB2814902.1 ABC transporter ATP-binding protein [Phaeocystidibacter luteus]
MVSATNIHKSFGDVEVLKGVDLEVHAGEIVSIRGTSGAGKTTLLQVLGTLDRMDKGELRYGETRLDAMKDKELSQFRNLHIGFVFQFHHLLPEFTALENVCMPGFIAGRPDAEVRKRAAELLEILNIQHRADHKPSQMSGGEQQRVAVARALINNPDLVFADEPTGNLDSVHAAEMHQLFLRLRDEFNQSFVIVTHNLELAQLADRKLEMKDGKML